MILDTCKSQYDCHWQERQEQQEEDEEKDDKEKARKRFTDTEIASKQDTFQQSIGKLFHDKKSHNIKIIESLRNMMNRWRGILTKIATQKKMRASLVRFLIFKMMRAIRFEVSVRFNKERNGATKLRCRGILFSVKNITLYIYGEVNTLFGGQTIRWKSHERSTTY